MSDIKISLDTAGPRGEISVVRVDGVIDTMTATDLEKVMNSLMERRRYNIIVDLGGVDYISSAGWGIFISNIREIRQHSGDIKLARMIPNVYEIFELLEFDSILKAFDGVEKAKSDFEGLRQAVPVPAGPALDQAATVNDPQPEEPPTTRVIQLPPAPQAEPIHETRAKSIDSRKISSEPKDLVLEMIAKDPFLSISEMKQEITRKHPSAKLGWWQIWGILRREKLLSKKNRFRRARFKSGSF
jgi:anti-sigma B factor antagonist